MILVESLEFGDVHAEVRLATREVHVIAVDLLDAHDRA